MPDFHLLYILLPGAIFLHVTEEFLFPGGFIEWYKELRPPKAGTGIKTGYLVWINTWSCRSDTMRGRCSGKENEPAEHFLAL